MAAIAAKLLIAMNDSSRRPRRPYPGLVASAEVRRSLLIGAAPRSLRQRCADQLANFAQQPIKLHRLGIELFTSGRERLLALAGKRVGRQADDRDVARLGLALQTPCRFPAVDDRHLQVHQDKVRPLGSRNLASFFAILGDQHFDLIGELKPHLEHVSAVLVVFDVENTEHGSPSLEHLSSTTSTHHANRAELLDLVSSPGSPGLTWN